MDSHAKNMEIRVMASQMGFRSGHFVERAGYHTRRPAGTNDWLMIETTGGAGIHAFGSKRLELPPGSVLLYGPGVPQDYSASRRGWELLWTHFPADGHLDRMLDWPPITGGARLIHLGAAEPEVTEALNEVVRWHESGAPDRHAFAANALERAILWCDRVSPTGSQAGVDSRVKAALAYVSAHLAEEMTVPLVASHAGVSGSRLSHLFASSVGMSLPAYVEERRMERAEDLLRMTSRPISEIAELIGFKDPLYFSKRFRARHGQSPRQWRGGLSTQEDYDASAGA